MKRIWASQEQGEMEEGEYIGNKPKTRAQQIEEVKPASEKIYKRMYPKLVHDLCDNGVMFIKCDCKLSEATINAMNSRGMTYEFVGDTGLVETISEIVEEKEETVEEKEEEVFEFNIGKVEEGSEEKTEGVSVW